VSSGKLMTTESVILPSFETIAPKTVPTTAVDNGDGTLTYTATGGETLTYDKASGEVTEINGINAHTITGTVKVAQDSLAPSTTLSISSLSVTSSDSNIYCVFSGVDTEGGFYYCHIADNWGGSIQVSGADGNTICTTSTQPYAGVTTNLTNQDYYIINASMSCPRDMVAIATIIEQPIFQL